jgi:hypothetical protein
MQNRSLHNTKLFHMGRLYSINMMMYVEEKRGKRAKIGRLPFGVAT